MRIRHLTLQAVGPFAGRHSIDVDALGASGLFLLEGPTGAGKSTLIDAIVFALYGKVASSEASDDRLRSAYAADDVESVVDLVFEVSAGIFRVRRTPAYQRAKKRGTGTTLAQATVKAWRLPADADVHADDDTLDALGVPLGNRLDEVGAELQRAVGLDRTQFVQTIVLPQGEFARFLRADPDKERRVLLQKIFGTEVYERLQVRLAEMRAEAQRAVEASRTSLVESTARFVGAARLSEDEGAGLRAGVDAASRLGDLASGAVAELVGGVAGRLRAEAADCSARASVAAASHAGARAALDEATALAGRIERRARLRTERDALHAQADVHTEAVVRVTAARAARAVRPQLVGADLAETAAQSARKGLAAALDALPSDVVPTGLVTGGTGPVGQGGEIDDDLFAGVDLTPGGRDGVDRPTGGAFGGPHGVSAELRRVVDAAHRAAVDESAVLRRVVEVEAGLEQRRQAVRAMRDDLDDLGAELALVDAWLAERPTARDALATALAGARERAARLGESEAALAAARALLADVDALTDGRAQLARAESRRPSAAAQAAATVEHERALRQARIAGLAGELATTLVAGDPCPVCGGVEHPGKAQVAADHVSAEQVEEAERERAAAEATLSAASSAVAELAGRVATLVDRVGEATPSSAAEAVRVAEQAVDLCRADGAEATRLDAQLAGFDTATRARQDERADVERRRAVRATEVDAARDALDAAEAEVIAARADHPTVAARHSALVERVDVTADVLDALSERDAAEEQARVRRGELDTALDEHGFATAADARAAVLAPDVLAELERVVTSYASALDRVTAGLADPELADLADDATADVAAARAHESVTRIAAEEAAGVERVAVARADAAAGAAETVVAAAGRVGAAVAESAPVLRMAGLASGTGGDNGKGLSLATFVLMRRFEDVVAAANERLLVMSDGRYELERSDEKEDVRTRNTGLAMRVLDHHTEQARDPRTLSGGETFYVSLCLALGMADVVSAEARGIELGTLFVDEGFGSLDPHTLDQVLAELGRLRAGGRMVGVVSHVETLKQSIADRVEIRRTAEGPSTLTVRAG